MIRRSSIIAGFCLLALGVLSPGRAADYKHGLFDRDILWRIVHNCLSDGGGADYCKNCPSPLLPRLADCSDISGMDPAAICRKTTEVWGQTADFVAFRDMKMCGCPQGFVHGLALPLRKVTGVEDPAKPAGIWRFAWDEAVKKIGAEDEDAIVIAANPRARRSQDQFHIHLVRLADGARQRLLDLKPVRVKDLSEVWHAAARHAAANGLARDGYGVAVAHDPSAKGFLVVTSADSLEQMFGAFSCSRRARK